MSKKICLIFRSKKRNEFSIEALFNSLEVYFKKKYDIESLFLPSEHYNSISSLKNNLNAVKGISADIFHITGEVNFVCKKLPKEKSIITIHDFVDLEKMHGLKRMIRKIFWYKIPLKKCKYIVCVSRKTLNELNSFFPFTKNKSFYIPNPIDDSYQIKEKNFNKLNPRILLIGTRENKNIERTILALKDISCELLIVGKLSNEQLSLLETNKINYTNVYRISNEEMLNAYIGCDILCFCSTYEGFGRPIIEANAIGRIVVTSNIEPMLEVGGDSAIFVDPYDIDSIKNGIINCIDNDDLREKTILNGFKNAEKYRANKIAEEYMNLYEKM